MRMEKRRKERQREGAGLEADGKAVPGIPLVEGSRQMLAVGFWVVLSALSALTLSMWQTPSQGHSLEPCP